MIKAITFDLDGVYFPDGKSNFITALQEHGVTEDEVKRVFLKSDEMNEQYKLGAITDEAYWTWARTEWKTSLTPEELQTLLIESYSVDPQVEALVKSVREHGYKTLICSNNFPARVNGLQNRFGFLDNFDVAVFSYEARAAKPSKKIFEELVRRSGVSAHEIAYADDDVTKLSGAKELGISVFVYEGFDAFVEHLKQLGVDTA